MTHCNVKALWLIDSFNNNVGFQCSHSLTFMSLIMNQGASLVLLPYSTLGWYRDTQANPIPGRSVDDTSIFSILQWIDDSSIHFDIAMD